MFGKVKSNLTDVGFLVSVAIVAVVAIIAYNRLLRPALPASVQAQLPPA